MEFSVRDLGRMPYAEALEVQKSVLEEVLAGNSPSTLLLVEHPAILTLGAAYHQENLLLTTEAYKQRGIDVSVTDRGGDVTYHCPGQLVAYPIFDLNLLGKDLHRWLRGLEEAVLVTLGAFGVEGRRFAPHTGVWVGDRKICALGIKVRRWVSMHGIALNCDNDLAGFGLIVPCGIQGYGVTSLTQELGRAVSVEEAKPKLVDGFKTVFGG